MGHIMVTKLLLKPTGDPNRDKNLARSYQPRTPGTYYPCQNGVSGCQPQLLLYCLEWCAASISKSEQQAYRKDYLMGSKVTQKVFLDIGGLHEDK